MASATQTLLISVDEYLSTPFRPDVDYVDGSTEARHMGDMDHGTLQGVLFAFFLSKRKEWHIWPALDTRMRISERKYRVPDLTIVDIRTPKERVIKTTPLLCIEVLSPDDTLNRMLERVKDYFAIGVGSVWIFDPQERFVVTVARGEAQQKFTQGTIGLPNSPIQVSLDEMFTFLDEY